METQAERKSVNKAVPAVVATLRKHKVSISSIKPPIVRRGAVSATMTNNHGIPGIPTPDYDSTPERSPGSKKREHIGLQREQLRQSKSLSDLSQVGKKGGRWTRREALSRPDRFGSRASPRPPPPPPPPKMSTLVMSDSMFSKRHPDLELGSLESFCINGSMVLSDPKPPPYYFEAQSRCSSSLLSQEHPSASAAAYKSTLSHSGRRKGVKFISGEDTLLASQDYRTLHGNRPAGHQGQPIARGMGENMRISKPSRKPPAPPSQT